MDLYCHAAEALEKAQALIIGAGAGMGVDSGLPDFRGNEGFWKAYPPMKALGLSFVEMANPHWFDRDPSLAWGFYGHRLNLYRRVQPHPGFQILKKWANRMKDGAFVFTSNVDGQFQKAGFSSRQILECHGSIHHFQCTGSCGGVWREDGCQIEVDPNTFRARPPFPTCPECGNLARPNILMFGDWRWLSDREEVQSRRLQSWLQSLTGPLVLVEVGAGQAVPTVRMTMEQLTNALDGLLIRINPREFSVPVGQVGIKGGASETLQKIDALLGQGQ